MKAIVLVPFLATAICFSLAPASAQNTDHVVASPTSGQGAVTPTSFNQRLETSALSYASRYPGAQIDRFVPFDVAYPHDAAELKALNGYGVILISAMSWHAEELPLAKVYLVRADGSEIDLKLVGQTKRQVASASNVGKEFGPNREDSFYLLPIGALAGAQLRCDFRINRNGFVVSQEALRPPNYGIPVAPAGPIPPRAAIKQIIDREYPSFGIDIAGDFK